MSSLALDPASLKASRRVCHLWNDFILRRVWGAKKKVLEKRLQERWRLNLLSGSSLECAIESKDIQHAITSMICDNTVIVVGREDGIVTVYRNADHLLLFTLDCTDERQGNWWNGGIQVALGNDVIGTYGGDVVRLWNKRTGILEYEDSHHGKSSRVFGLAVTSDGLVISGGHRGTLVILEKSEEGVWTVKHRANTGDDSQISHIYSDGKMAAIGTDKTIQMWDVGAGIQVLDTQTVNIDSTMLVFVYPHIFSMGRTKLYIWNRDRRAGQDPGFPRELSRYRHQWDAVGSQDNT